MLQAIADAISYVIKSAVFPAEKKGRKNMVVLKRKQILIAGIAALVAIAGYLNFSYGESETAGTELGEVKLVSSDSASEADFFSEARLEREIGRSQSVASLQSIARDASTSETGRAAAEAEMVELTRLSETESTIESIICAKGFEDAVIYISEGKVTAIIKAEKLESEDVAKIVDVITTQTGIPAADINIVEAQ